MAKLTFTAKVWSKPVQEYIDRFGHGPSPETCKFRSDAEISAMAEDALSANEPIEDWKVRSSIKLGTILDDLYHSDAPVDHKEIDAAESEPLTKKEARKQAIQATIESKQVAKKKKRIENSSTERVYKARKSDSKNVRIPTSPENEIYIESVRAKVASRSTRFDISYSKAKTMSWKYETSPSKTKVDNSENKKTEGEGIAEIDSSRAVKGSPKNPSKHVLSSRSEKSSPKNTKKTHLDAMPREDSLVYEPNYVGGGWIYIFSNPAYKDNIIKVGETSRTTRERGSELFTTGVPEPFSLEYKAYVKNHSSAEKRVHHSLDSFRVNKNREFFDCEINVAVRAIRQCSEIIDESFPSRELAEEIRRIDLELERDRVEQERIVKEEENKKQLERREIDRQIETFLKPKEYRELSPAGKIWRLYWSSGKTWSKSLNGVAQFLLFCVYAVLGPTFWMGGAAILLGDFEPYLLPIGVMGMLSGVKLLQLMYVANDRF
jgi:hypothetical protein